MKAASVLPQLLSGQAERNPGATALVYETESVSYGEMDQASNKLARYLLANGVKRGDRIPFLIPKSPRAILAMVGVLKAGAIYVPIDTSGPPERLRRILNACDAKLVLAGHGTDILLSQVLEESELAKHIDVGWLEPGTVAGAARREHPVHAEYLQESAEPLPVSIGGADPAHILFTSGSTGMPKGVVITHDNVLHFVTWAVRHFGINETDRNSGHPPLHFDLSTFDVYGTFAAGAQLHLAPPRLNLLPQKLASFIRDEKLTQWFSVPSVMNFMAQSDVVREGDFPALKRVLWCGEVLPTPALIYWMKKLPHVQFTNMYGPTEATIASSFHTVSECPDNELEDIPIGRACPGEELLVLDEDHNPVPVGETGDLHIGGVGLSPGYWRDDEKTAQAFVTRPGDNTRIYRTGDLARVDSDGRFHFIGRADSQIKSRGYRIELGEIEAALDSLGSLRESAVVAVAGDNFAGPTICCAYVLRDGNASPAALRLALAKTLPSYMFPARWARYDSLPRNANGKIDRRALREDFESAPAATPAG